MIIDHKYRLQAYGINIKCELIEEWRLKGERCRKIRTERDREKKYDQKKTGDKGKTKQKLEITS